MLQKYVKSQGLFFTQSCLILCDPMDCSTPGFPVHHQLGISIDIPEEVTFELRSKEIKEINQRVCGESGNGWRKMEGEHTQTENVIDQRQCIIFKKLLEIQHA